MLYLPGYFARMSVRGAIYLSEYSVVGCRGWKSITDKTLLLPREIRSMPSRGMSYSKLGYHKELKTYTDEYRRKEMRYVLGKKLNCRGIDTRVQGNS